MTAPAALTPEQCRRARELLGWSQGRLAAKARLAAETLNRFERGLGSPRMGTRGALARALVAAGVELAPDGARLRDRRAEVP